MTGTVLLERAAQGVAIVRLDRPAKANAYTQAMLGELIDLLANLRGDRHVRTVVLAGTGNHFCAGADRDELRARAGEDALDLASRRAFDLLAELPQTAIAAVDGAAYGGGFELALACDYRIATEAARFAFPETKLGLIPAAGGMRRLRHEVGLARTKELVLFGRELDAVTAFGWGIVNAVEPDAVAGALRAASALLARDPVALRVAKAALNAADADPQRALEGAFEAFLYERKRSR